MSVLTALSVVQWCCTVLDPGAGLARRIFFAADVTLFFPYIYARAFNRKLN